MIQVESPQGVREFRSAEQAIEYGKRTVNSSPSRWTRVHNALVAGIPVTLAAGGTRITFRPRDDINTHCI